MVNKVKVTCLMIFFLLFTLNLFAKNEASYDSVRFKEGSNYVELKASSSLASKLSFELPTADGSSGEALVTNGAGVLSFSAVSAAPPTISRQVFTSGSGTYTTPAGVDLLRVTIIGAGGGGGGSGTSAGSAATAGGNTTFGTMTATGGGAGGWLTGGANGSYSISGYVTYYGLRGNYGNPGQINPSVANNTQLAGGNGGNPAFGFGIRGYSGPGGGGVSANGCGGGGGGAGTDNVGGQRGGGGGGGGGGIIFWINSPAASYSYSVGSGGSAGGAGPTGRTGGNGSNGCVIVEEFDF